VGFGKPKIDKLVTHGIYSKILHPMYWGVNLTFVGLVLLYPKPWFILLCLFIILYFFYRMRIETSYLSEKLGEEYQKHKKETWI